MVSGHTRECTLAAMGKFLHDFRMSIFKAQSWTMLKTNMTDPYDLPPKDNQDDSITGTCYRHRCRRP
jgi:hypothetical protein